MFIKSQNPAAAGTLLKLECEAGESDKIRGVGRVVWLRSEPNEHGPAGMGVKFVKLEPGSKELIGELVTRLAEAGIEARNISAPPETVAAARRAPEVATPVSSPGSIPSAAVRSSIPAATRSPAPGALGASANRSPMPAIATARAPIPAGGRTPTPAASVPSNGAGALTPAAEPAAKLTDARTASPQPQRAPDAPAESVASEQSAAATSVASPGATAAADTGAGAQAKPSGSESATATRLPSVISVPPPPARRGALRIWLGIVIGVAVLLAIIFADDSTGSSPAPAAKSGKPAPSDHAQLSAPPAPPPAAAELSAADSRSTTPGSTSAAGDPPTAQVEPAEQPSTPPPATAAPQPTPQPTTPQTATPTAETPAATTGAFVMEFTSRPTGATVTVGDRNVVTPGRLEFGSDMPARVKVIAKKPGFQQSSAWIDHTGFENINGTLVRRVTMILPAEAAASPSAAPAHPR